MAYRSSKTCLWNQKAKYNSDAINLWEKMPEEELETCECMLWVSRVSWGTVDNTAMLVYYIMKPKKLE